MKDDDIEGLLKQHFQQQHEYLDDNGFTANLMSALPQKKRVSPWIKYSIYWGFILLTSLFVFSQLPIQTIAHTVTAFFITATTKEFLLIAAASFAMIITYVSFTFMSETEN